MLCVTALGSEGVEGVEGVERVVDATVFADMGAFPDAVA